MRVPFEYLKDTYYNDFFVFCFMCVCKHSWARECVCVCVCVHAYLLYSCIRRSEGSLGGYLPQKASFTSYETGGLEAYPLDSALYQVRPKDPLSLSSVLYGYKHSSSWPGLLQGFWEWNSGCHACKKPSPQPFDFFFRVCYSPWYLKDKLRKIKNRTIIIKVSCT